VFFGFGYRRGIAKGIVTALGADESMSDEQNDTALEKRIRLPEPDVKNITVLTENLPNEPVLPWHRFDSPWLEGHQEGQPRSDNSNPSSALEGSSNEDEQQLSLDLDGDTPVGTSSAAAKLEAALGHTDPVQPEAQS
jgi:hypothetical protein